MVYYNYRHYNTRDGRWIGRDKIEAKNLYTYIENSQLMYIDLLGYFSMPSCNSKRDIGNNRIVIKRTGLSNAGSERTFDKTFEMLNDQLFYIGLLSKFSTYSQTTMLGLANLKLHYTSWQNITEDAVYNIFDDKVLPSVGKQERNQIVKALIQIDKNLAENKWGTKIDVEVAHEKCEEEFCLFGSNEFEWTQQQTLIFSFVVKKSGKIARWQKGKNTIVNIMPPSQIKDVHIAQAELLAAYEANKKWNLTVGY